MTLDLDGLGRDAQDAASHGEVELYRSITPQSVLALIERVRALDRYKAAALKAMDALTREYEALERAAKAAGVKDA